MNGLEVVGIGAVAVTLAGTMYKISVDHRKAYSDLTKEVIKVVEKNATAVTSMEKSIDENKRVMTENTRSFNTLLQELIRSKS